MRNFEKFNAQMLNRADLKKIKGSQSQDACSNAWTACDPKCGHFSTDYDRFLTCVNGYHITGCSPLGGWGTICGNFN